MPISGIIIRLKSANSAEALHAPIVPRDGVSFGLQRDAALAAVIDAPDYATHDRLLSSLRDAPEVCAVDIVFHDFSDVNGFVKLPARQRNIR